MSAHTEARTTGAKAPPRHVDIRVKRREGPDKPPYWEEFRIPYRPNLNIISALMEIRKNPVTRDGRPTTPPVWDMNCLEQVCGICTMVINGKVRQSCSALVDQLDQPITLEPMSKFPLLRDLFAKDPERAARRLVHVPMGRFAEPAEVAAAVAFLCTPAAGYINGINLPVDGGRTPSL